MITEENKNVEQKEEEQRILEELLEVVEQRDALVALLEEDRLKSVHLFYVANIVYQFDIRFVSDTDLCINRIYH